MFSEEEKKETFLIQDCRNGNMNFTKSLEHCKNENPTNNPREPPMDPIIEFKSYMRISCSIRILSFDKVK